jgi:Flp pilus assembly protein TadG
MMNSLTRAARRGRRERGSELIEFTIVFPLLLLIVSGIVDMGFLFQSYEVVTNAAREGARIAILPGYASPTDPNVIQANVQSRVNAYIAASGLKRTAETTVIEQTITLAGGQTVSAYRVAVVYPHTFALFAPIARYFGGSFGTIYVGASAAMRQEMPAF